MLSMHPGASGWLIYIDDNCISIERECRRHVAQETMGVINLRGYRLNQLIYSALDAPRSSHWRRTATSLDMTVRSLQQNVTIGVLSVVRNSEMFEQAGHEWLPGPEPRRAKITIVANCQYSAAETIAGFDHARVLRGSP